jgi:ABC-type Mn2+/Zn2+ transport system ATPase subunit
MEDNALRLLVLGKGGSGKSELIKFVINILDDKCVVASYMAAATQVLRGVTLHYLFKLPINTDPYGELSEVRLADFRE